MSKWLLTADTHLGGNGMPPNRREVFATKQEHDDLILKNLIDSVTPIDTLFILGDCINGRDGLEMLSSVVCAKKVLILGNHCHEKVHSHELLTVFKEVLGLYSKRNLWWSHCPMHPDHLRGRMGNIHGHLHTDQVLLSDGSVDPHYFNVGVDRHNFKPITFAEMCRQANWTYEKEVTPILPR